MDKVLSYKNEDPSLDPWNPCKKSGQDWRSPVSEYSEYLEAEAELTG